MRDKKYVNVANFEGNSRVPKNAEYDNDGNIHVKDYYTKGHLYAPLGTEYERCLNCAITETEYAVSISTKLTQEEIDKFLETFKIESIQLDLIEYCNSAFVSDKYFQDKKKKIDNIAQIETTFENKFTSTFLYTDFTIESSEENENFRGFFYNQCVLPNDNICMYIFLRFLHILSKKKNIARFIENFVKHPNLNTYIQNSNITKYYSVNAANIVPDINKETSITDILKDLIAIESILYKSFSIEDVNYNELTKGIPDYHYNSPITLIMFSEIFYAILHDFCNKIFCCILDEVLSIDDIKPFHLNSVNDGFLPLMDKSYHYLVSIDQFFLDSVIKQATTQNGFPRFKTQCMELLQELDIDIEKTNLTDYSQELFNSYIKNICNYSSTIFFPNNDIYRFNLLCAILAYNYREVSILPRIRLTMFMKRIDFNKNLLGNTILPQSSIKTPSRPEHFDRLYATAPCNLLTNFFNDVSENFYDKLKCSITNNDNAYSEALEQYWAVLKSIYYNKSHIYTSCSEYIKSFSLHHE